MAGPARILDVGCGTGWNPRWLLEQGYQGSGVHLRPEGLRETRTRHPSAAVLQGDAIRLPLSDCSLDGVLALDILEHTDDVKALREMWRVLRPGDGP